ncbi:MAG: hypothetical protein ABEJ86_02355 [Halococcoides sp.]
MTEQTVSNRTYRRLDTASKLLGLALVAGALHVGLMSPFGLALAASGTVLATATVFIDHE